MFCDRCEKLAMKRSVHKCARCSRNCEFKEQRICSYCSSLEDLCSICNKNLKNKGPQVEQIHPFFGSSSGCKSCGR